MTVTQIDFAENLSNNVGRFLQREYPNLAFANTAGEPTELVEEDKIGLLDNDSVRQPRWWPNIFRKSRRRFVGVLWFYGQDIGATQSSWVLEVYGHQNLRVLTEVAKRLTSKYSVPVKLKIFKESPVYETLPRDYNI
jgi:hypothetical protein